MAAALGVGTAAGLAAIGPGLITQRLSGPRPRVVRAGESHLRVAACRVRFPTSVAAQIYCKEPPSPPTKLFLLGPVFAAFWHHFWDQFSG